MFRLGSDKVVRLPRHPGAVESVAHEQRWLARLGPRLPVATPVPLELGGPGEGFAWPWSVYHWLDGVNPVAGAVERPRALAADLAAFVTALRGIETRGGPPNPRVSRSPNGTPPPATPSPGWRGGSTPPRSPPCGRRRCGRRGTRDRPPGPTQT